MKAAITRRTKAIIVSQIQGMMADMDAIMRIARKHDLIVIEDCGMCGMCTNCKNGDSQ